MGAGKDKYYFSTRDLVTIAIIGALGGIFSVYMGYIIADAYNAIRVWFPVAESLSGIHVIWIVLVLGITNKKGTGTLVGLMKGIVEFFMGSRLGLFVVLLSLIEGLFAEIGFWPLRKYRRVSYLLAGGLGTASNVVTFQVFAPFNNPFLFGLATVMAFISGVVFAGIFSLGIVDSLEEAGILRREPHKKEGLRLTATKVAAVLVALSIVLIAGAVTFLPPQGSTPASTDGATLATPLPEKTESLSLRVTGSVAAEKEYFIYDYKDHFVSINAPEIQNPHGTASYEGLPLKYVLQDAGVKPGATSVDIVGSDGYYNTLTMAEATGDGVLLVDVRGRIKLIAKDLSQEYWVDMIATVKVY
ncbi:MAG: ABC-type cobalt transport system, permease component [Methanocella sp. PtaU1.Bin125]|nr:MAG: ABC-type cobalt transport system, permease component [Methanocella sp. PtaU1.Bin125]